MRAGFHLRSFGRILCVSLFLTAATAAEAQEIATSFDQLRVLVKPGDTVTVTDFAGNETRGRILTLSSSSLALSVGETQRTWTSSEVRTVNQRRRASLGTGAKWGFFIGAGIGALAGLGAAQDGYSGGESVGIAFLGAGLYGALGAGIGVGVRSLMHESHVVYAGRPAPQAKLTLSPILSDRRKGVALSFGF